jgi:hypothetical protein
MRKRCWKCRRKRRLDKFTKDRSRPDGLDAVCLDCRREIYRVWAKKVGRKTYAEEREFLQTSPVLFCNTCKQYKPREEFWKNRNNARKVSHACKVCMRKANNARAKTPRWRERRRAIELRLKLRVMQQFGSKCHDCGVTVSRQNPPC